MNYTVAMENETTVVAKLEVSVEEIKGLKANIIKKLSSKVEVPGFRKGKAPAKAIEEQNAGEITEDVINDVIRKYFPEMLEKENLNAVNMPSLVNFDLEKGTFELKFEILPQAKVGNYKGLTVEKNTYYVTDYVINEELKKLATTKATSEDVTDSAKMDDTVTIDFEGFIDGVAFPGGKAEKHDIKLGSKSFIGDFEEQIVGKNIGEEFDVTVSFPETYHAKELAGKPAVFKVKLHAVKRPKAVEINDEFAKAEGYENLDDMKAKKYHEIKDREDTRIQREFEDKIIQEVMKTSEIHVPKSIIEREVEGKIKQFEQQLQQQGMNIDSYLEMTKTKREDMVKQIAPSAEVEIKLNILLSEIAELEKIEIAKEELEGEIEKIGKAYNMEKAMFESQLKSAGNYEAFLQNLTYERKARKAVECLVANTVASVKG